MLVNTSFNVRGEPIVCTPEDAYRCFMRTEMDYLVDREFPARKTGPAALGERRLVEGRVRTGLAAMAVTHIIPELDKKGAARIRPRDGRHRRRTVRPVFFPWLFDRAVSDWPAVALDRFWQCWGAVGSDRTDERCSRSYRGWMRFGLAAQPGHDPADHGPRIFRASSRRSRLDFADLVSRKRPDGERNSTIPSSYRVPSEEGAGRRTWEKPF